MIDAILQKIDRIYDLELGVDIRDFLVGAETCSRLGADPAHGSVFVSHEGADEGLQLGVYIGEERLRRLEGLDLEKRLDASELEHLLVAIEEVSHFAYLYFSASCRRRVTQLELELQAEVDKFVTFTLMLASSNGGRVPANLVDRLFGDFEPRRGLDVERKERYQAASSLASRYCSRVVQAALAEESLSHLLPELRSFYRLSQSGKIKRIHHAVYRG